MKFIALGLIPNYAIEVVAKIRGVCQMGTRTGMISGGTVITPTVNTEIQASDQMMCYSTLQQIAIAKFGFDKRENLIFVQNSCP